MVVHEIGDGIAKLVQKLFLFQIILTKSSTGTVVCIEIRSFSIIELWPWIDKTPIASDI